MVTAMNNAHTNKYRLGLDLGTNSIGWAAVNLDENGEPCGVLDMGVRIFPDGRDEQSKTSNAVARRTARGARRRRDRYLDRRKRLMDALVEFGLMPKDAEERKGLERLDPYVLRALALDQPLQPFELGRALFHLNQRRGFKSNRKTEGGDDPEKTRLSERIGDLRRSIGESGVRTLGEFLAQRHEKRETVRARPELGLYPDRAMYQAEFDAIREKQEPHQTLSGDQWDKLRDKIIFFQRDLKPVDPGWCQFEYENEERRAAKALPVFQEYRMLLEVNNLRVRVGLEPERPLHEEQRERVLQRLRSGKEIRLREGKNDEAVNPTRDLKLPSGAVLNLAAGGRRAIKGDETTAKLMKKDFFGNRWHNLSLDERNEIVKFLLDMEEPETVRKKALEEWGLTGTQAEAVAKVSLAPGYGNLSEKAINKMLPHLGQGLVYSSAVQAAGYAHHSDLRNEEAHDNLPYYGEVLPRDAVGADPTKDPKNDGEPARYGRFPNPTVHIGLNQLRRVLNRLIESHGKPEEIVVELARDLKSNKEQRDKIRSQQNKGASDNKRFTEWLEKEEQIVTSNILRKLRLWEEQKSPSNVLVCPYTGQPLSFAMVVDSRTEIDHILPFSRTLDNSTANMVVCLASANRAKGDRSPYEAFGHSPTGYDYDSILSRTAKFPQNKKWRFQPDAMNQFEEEDRFLDRQLNETSYLSRTARTYLAHLYDEKGEGPMRVHATPGRMTALLRRGWGLEGILRVSDEGETTRKQRDDHRHHAIDAFVLACTTQGQLQKFARAAGSSHNPEERLAAVAKEALPWEEFHRSHLKPFLDRLVVSYKPDHGKRGVNGKTTGQLHNDTAYGLVELSEDGPSTVVIRKKVADFKKRVDLDASRDPVMGNALKALWDQVESEGGNPTDFAERAATQGVLLNGQRQTVRRVRVLDQQRVIPIKDRKGTHYKGYLPGGNEFAEVWRMRDGSWQMVVVPTFYANQPGFDLENFRPTDKSGRKDPTAKRLMRLHIDDMGAIGEGDTRRIVRVRKITNATTGVFVVLDVHNEANVAARVGKDMKENRYSTRQLRIQGFRKVGVDEIGRVRDPGPRKP